MMVFLGNPFIIHESKRDIPLIIEKRGNIV